MQIELPPSETAATSKHDDLPTFDPESEALVEPRRPRGRSRREFIRLAIAVAGGVGLAFSDWFASPFLRLAGAALYTRWEGCTPEDYYDSNLICVPTQSIMTGSTAAWGTCGLYGIYHKHDQLDYWQSGGNYYKGYFTQWGDTCYGRNAWIWNGAHGTMCSDGNKQRYRAAYGQWWLEYNDWSHCKTTV